MPRRAPLRQALHSFQPADDREAAFQRELLALLDAPGDPFSRDHFEPGHFTASAFVLSPDRQRLLMILHAKLGLWLQPGGHVDPDDADIFAAALREVAEETSVTTARFATSPPAIFDVDVHVIPARKNDPAHKHFDVRVLLIATDEAFAADSDALAARWVPLAQITEADTDESVLRAVRKLLTPPAQ